MQNKVLIRPETEKLFTRALNGEATREIPFWLMRQAGRYLPEYRAVREKAGSFLDLCFNPELAAEVTLQPVARFGMDAAILFSDILVVPYALGQKLSFEAGEGPRLAPQTRLDEVDFESFCAKLAPVFETVKRVRNELAGDKALIGFAGAPWTVACYMIEGRGGNFETARQFALENPAALDALVAKLTEATACYLIKQIAAGADAVQLFDSWAGLVPAAHFARRCIAPVRAIVQKIHAVYPGFPVIGFPRGAGLFYRDYIDDTGVACVGVDQHAPLEKVAACAAGRAAVQGNLDPLALLAGGKTLEAETKRIFDAAGNAPFVFNLGHGVIKETPPAHVAALARLIREFRR
ncbi:MAG: uroporphyrinogen decarboxylase [Alphaproteobacteria bacterium]|nr:uroporphyrinogen decarboxylase [Alphaproteobacteria bacterium]MDE2335970.1 uroporphyrinogen decarboxylase [Alphaproteobacteria bacterium]